MSVEGMEEEEEAGDTQPNPPTQSQPTAGGTGATKKKTKTTSNPEPCLCCGETCRKNQAAVKCIMCTLWAHKTCIKMPDSVHKSLDQQFKETGSAFWVCRPCQSYAQRIQHNFSENNKRHEATEKKVDENAKEIEKNKKEIEDMKKEMRKMMERITLDREERDERVFEEMQERDVRRANLVIHGVREIPEQVRGSKERAERDKDNCEEIFRTMRANVTKDDLRFCRRMGEKNDDPDKPRPIVIGLESEEVKRHLLAKAKNLQNSRFEKVSIVPDLTRIQRSKENDLVEEAKDRNKKLSRQDVENNLKWIVVGRKGERRLIKGVEREDQRVRNENRRRWAGEEEETRRERRRGPGEGPGTSFDTGRRGSASDVDYRTERNVLPPRRNSESSWNPAARVRQWWRGENRNENDTRRERSREEDPNQRRETTRAERTEDERDENSQRRDQEGDGWNMVGSRRGRDRENRYQNSSNGKRYNERSENYYSRDQDQQETQYQHRRENVGPNSNRGGQKRMRQDNESEEDEREEMENGRRSKY